MVVLLLAGCSIEPSERRLFDPDEEFAKLDGPEVPRLQATLERAAIEALAEGKYSSAAGLYKQLIDQNPEEPRYKLGFAECMRRLGDYEVAIAMYETVLRKQPNNIDAAEGKALAMLANGDTQDAAKQLQRIVERDRTRWRTLNALGILFAAKGMYSESVAYLKEGLRVSDGNPAILNNLGLVQGMQRRYGEAIDTFEEAARKADAHQKKQIELNLALIYGISGRMQDAEKTAARHLDENALQNNLGLYAHLTNNRELAKSYLNMALSGTPIYYQRAWKNLDIISSEDQGSAGRPTSKRVTISD